MTTVRQVLRTPVWLLGDLAFGVAGLVIDALSATGRALCRAADRLARRTHARLTIDDEVKLLLLEFRSGGAL